MLNGTNIKNLHQKILLTKHRKRVIHQMITHQRVVAEWVMGGINGTVHVSRDSFKKPQDPEKRKNYLIRLDTLHQEYQVRYQRNMAMLSGRY